MESIWHKRNPGYPISYTVFMGEEEIGVVGKPKDDEGMTRTTTWVTDPITAEFTSRQHATDALVSLHRTGEWIA